MSVALPAAELVLGRPSVDRGHQRPVVGRGLGRCGRHRGTARVADGQNPGHPGRLRLPLPPRGGDPRRAPRVLLADISRRRSAMFRSSPR